MDEIRQPATIANGGIVFLSISDKDEKEDEKHPGYIYYYKTNNCTLTGNLDSSVSLAHYESSRTIVSSSYRDDGGDAYVSVGKNYDEAHDVDVLNGGFLRINNQAVSGVDIQSGGSVYVNENGVLSNVDVSAGGKLGVFTYRTGTVATKVTVRSGGILEDGTFLDTTLEKNADCGNAEGFVNLGESQTFTKIVKAGGITTAYIGNQSNTGLKCTGKLCIESDGVVLNGEAASGAIWNINGGGMAESAVITSGGSISINQGGNLNGVEVFAGGNLSMYTYRPEVSASNVYVHSGGVLAGGIFLDTTLEKNADCGNAEGFVNLSDDDQTFAKITTLNGGSAVAYVYDQEISNLRAKGSLFVSEGGILKEAEAASGAIWNINGGGMAESATVAEGAFVTINWNGAGNGFVIQSGGSVYVNENGVLSNVDVSAGGKLGVFTYRTGTVATKVTVRSGGILEDGTFLDTTLEKNADCGNAEGFVNLSDDDQTFAKITTLNGGSAVAYVYDQEISNLRAKGSLFVSEGGILKEAEAASGAVWNISSGGTVEELIINKGGWITTYSGGRIEQSFEIEGKLTINGGGVARIWSASTVAGESATLENGGMIEFLVASAVLGGEALLNDYTKVSGNGKYTITVSGDERTGEYRLIGNAAAFNKNVTITVENTEFSGTFQWNGSGYNTVMLDDRAYTLNIDENNDLVLGIGMNPTRVDYVFAEIGQMFYSNREAPEGSGLDGVLMEIPYSADITVTIDKALAEGLYSFTTSVTDVNSSVNCFQIQVSDGESGSDGEPAPKTISYISDGMCQTGTLVSETTSTMTFQFATVNNGLLVDTIQNDTIRICVDNNNSSGDLITKTSGGHVNLHSGERLDINKKLCVFSYNIQGTLQSDNQPFQLKVYSTEAYYRTANKYTYNAGLLLHNKVYRNLSANIEWVSYGQTFLVTVHAENAVPEGANSDEDRLTCDITFEESIDPGQSQRILSINEKNEESIDTELVSFSPITKPVIRSAPWDKDHCWIAVAVNMLNAAGYLDVDPYDLYNKLSMLYYLRDNFKSEGSHPTRVFNDLLYKTVGVVRGKQDICIPFSNIVEALDHINKENGNVVATISYSGWNEGEQHRASTKSYHVITCYEATKIDNEWSAYCADSDAVIFDSDSYSDIIKAFSEVKIWCPITYEDLKPSDGGRGWYLSDRGLFHIDKIVTLVKNTTGKKIQESDIPSYHALTPKEGKNKVYAARYADIQEENDTFFVCEEIYDSIVLDGGRLIIATDAEAEEMIVHNGGNASFNSGSIAKGTIRTTGGVLTVESGVDVSDAEFDFAVSRMDGGNDTVLLNSLSNVSGSKLTITIVNGQSAGKYVLAGGATNFNATLSVVGEFDYSRDVGEGFENGLIGELGLDNTLKIEGRTYSLVLEEDNLALVISARQESPFGIVGDFNGDGKAMLVTESDNTFTVYSEGAAWSGLTLDDGWFVAGIGDFNGDGADDFLRVNDEGYVVGEMSNGEGAFAPQVLNFLNEGWDILGVGDFNGNGTDDVLIANPTAASETVGLLGYWESGATWTLINGYSAEWECVATGDFNGDGKCDMLWRNWFEGEGGGTYNAYCTWIVDDPVDWRMVSVANPGEWNFLCSGDFDGDKMNDIAMINDEGVVGIWGVNDGWLSSWSILSAVTPEWQLAGVGDFNADGTDDIAWCSTTTSQVGCWQIENKELASWSNVAFLS